MTNEHDRNDSDLDASIEEILSSLGHITKTEEVEVRSYDDESSGLDVLTDEPVSGLSLEEGSSQDDSADLPLTSGAWNAASLAEDLPIEKEAPVSTRKRTVLIALVSLFTVLALLVGAEFAFSHNRVHQGVSVAGIDVGGMTLSEAETTIGSDLGARAERSVTLSAGDLSWDVLGTDVGLSFDSAGLAQQAFDIGKGDDVISGRFSAWFGGVDIPAMAKFDTALVDPLVDLIEAEVTVPAIQSSVSWEGLEFSVVAGEDGTRVDDGSLLKLMNDAFLGADDSIEIPVVAAPMDITPAIAQDGADRAEKLVAGPAKLTHESQSWEFDPLTVSKWITFEATESAGGWQLNPKIDPDSARPDIKAKVGSALGTPAKDAQFYESGGKLQIRPSAKGTGVDMVQLAGELSVALMNTESDKRTVQLKVTEVDPDLTTEAAQALGIKDRLATYTTSYTTGATNRNINIHRMAELLSGSIVAPGGVWSFHETGGPTTVAKGFKPAGAIMNGVVVDELGGGICQVATTVFNAVFESGFPVVERSPHSRYMSNYPTGRDAAVSWKVPDLKWRNDSPNHVVMTTSYTASTVTVTLWGTSTGYQVSSSTGPWSIGGTVAPLEKPNPNLPLGKRKVVQSAAAGRTVVVTRTVKKDGVVLRTDSFKSTYRPVQEIVEVGTGPAVVVPSTNTTP